MGTVIIKSPNISINFYFGFFVLFQNSQLQDSCTTSPDSVAAVVSQHPGRKLAEPDDWNQIAGSFKKFVCPLSII